MVWPNFYQDKEYKWGIGGGIGLGAEYMFEPGIVISLAYRFQGNVLDTEMLIQKGLKIGLGCRF